MKQFKFKNRKTETKKHFFKFKNKFNEIKK